MGLAKAGLTVGVGWAAYPVADFGRELAGAAPALLGYLLFTAAAAKAPPVVPEEAPLRAGERDEEAEAAAEDDDDDDGSLRKQRD